MGVFILAQRDHEPGEGDAKVVPASSAVEFHKRMSSVGRSDSQAFADKGSARSNSNSTDGGAEEEKHHVPMPLSLQYQYLAITDVYNAIREGLTTPERHHGDHSVRRRASLVSTLHLISSYPHMRLITCIY